MKKIVVLGLTGSIGTQAAEVVRNSQDISIIGGSCMGNTDKLLEMAEEFSIKHLSVSGEREREDLLKKLKERNITDTEVYLGPEGLEKLSVLEDADIVLTSVVGLSGLMPTVKAIEAGKDIALANKETLVGAGSIITELAVRKGVKILPVDSEHSAIFQSMQGYKNEDIKRIILTASGGAFRGKKRKDLLHVRAEDALKHPNWVMGKKVTVDSATLVNKGLEAIEARWLFDTMNIDVHIHPESILHSAVEFNDGSVIGQMGVPDMKLPIQYALNYPDRKNMVTESLDLFKVGKLTFEKPDTDTFRCLKLASDAMKEGGYAPLVLNTADEAAVELFLKDMISFTDIERIIEESLAKYSGRMMEYNLDGVMELDRMIREDFSAEYGIWKK